LKASVLTGAVKVVRGKADVAVTRKVPAVSGVLVPVVGVAVRYDDRLDLLLLCQELVAEWTIFVNWNPGKRFETAFLVRTGSQLLQFLFSFNTCITSKCHDVMHLLFSKVSQRYSFGCVILFLVDRSINWIPH
jgi:hypothetical protein